MQRKWRPVFVAAAVLSTFGFVLSDVLAAPPNAQESKDGKAEKKARRAAAGKKNKDKGPPAVVKTPTRKAGQRTYPAEFAVQVDEIINAALEKEDIPASPTCSDAEFIRRATLDIIGRIPTRERVREFLADAGS